VTAKLLVELAEATAVVAAEGEHDGPIGPT